MIPYKERILQAKNPALKKLFQIIEEKKTNLALSIDVTTQKELLELTDLIGPQICVLKTHIDILEDFDPSLIAKLNELKAKHNFLIFEDRKFADIGNTVKHQYGGGIYKMSEWADIVNCHTVPGPGIINGLKEVGMPKGAGLLLLAQMSSAGNLAKGEYTLESLVMAQEHNDFVIGFISQERLLDDPCMVHMSPGVKLSNESDGLGQQYMTPKDAIDKGNDIIIVGRGIIKADDPLYEAKRYREAAWDAYLACS